MEFNTDYVRQQISDQKLRDLLIKSRTRNTLTPVYYEGRKYWCLDDLTQEKHIEGRNQAFKEFSTFGIIGMVVVLALMYVVLPLFLI